MRTAPFALTVIASLGCALALVAAPARAAEQMRSVPAFTSVETTGPFVIDIDVGPAQTVKATGNEHFLELLRTEVIDGKLKISLRDKVVTNIDDPHVSITVPSLNAFTMAGAGEVKIHHVSGDRLDVVFGGAGALKVDGKVRQFKLNVGGVGDIDTRALQAENADVRVGGVGSVKVTATARLDASVGGVGSLTYYGHPRIVNTSGGGLGSIDKGD